MTSALVETRVAPSHGADGLPQGLAPLLALVSTSAASHVPPGWANCERSLPGVAALDMSCINWHGTAHGKGYGETSVRNKQVLAHRHIWEECFGPIPEGHDIHHACENPSCINPAHLQSLTRKQHVHVHKQWVRGLAAARAKRLARTHCKHGHEFTEENTYLDPSANNARVCKTCRDRNKRAYLDRLKERRAGLEATA